jgi:hypothetical protein
LRVFASILPSCESQSASLGADTWDEVFILWDFLSCPHRVDDKLTIVIYYINNI